MRGAVPKVVVRVREQDSFTRTDRERLQERARCLWIILVGMGPRLYLCVTLAPLLGCAEPRCRHPGRARIAPLHPQSFVRPFVQLSPRPLRLPCCDRKMVDNYGVMLIN